PSAGASLGIPNLATVTIVNNNAPAFQFSAASYTANESDGAATITVIRSGSTQSAVSVRYATGGGTAVAGSHYAAASGVLSFAAGETRKTFSVGLVDNLTSDGDKTVGLSLTAPSPGAILGAQSRASLRIVDDENPNGVIQFGTTQAWFNENAG